MHDFKTFCANPISATSKLLSANLSRLIHIKLLAVVERRIGKRGSDKSDHGCRIDTRDGAAIKDEAVIRVTALADAERVLVDAV